MPVLVACAGLVCSLALGGCSVDIGGFSFMSENSEDRAADPASTAIASAPARVVPQDGRVTAEGACETDASGQVLPPAIAEGITECELVRLKGTRPTDVLIGDSGKGQREVQVLYSEPGGREIYMFTDNRLARIVKPGQG
jgi:hypothetical protein